MKNKLIMDNDWTKDLSKRLGEHRLDGFAPGMWPNIEKAVLAQQAAEKRKHRLVWLRRTAAATAAAAAVAAVVWLTNGTSDVARQVQSAAVSRHPLAEAGTALPTANGVGAAPSAAAMPAAAYAHRHAMPQQFADKQAEPQSQPVLLASAAAVPEANAVPDTTHTVAQQPTQKKAESEPRQSHATNGAHYAASEASISQSRHIENKWSVGLYAFNSPSKISLGESDGGVMANGKLYDAMYGDANAVAPSIGVADVEMHHKQPVSFGATARYKMNSWLSVEAGLAYTYLSADYADEYMGCEQRLHYVGVPVKLNCNLYSGRRVDVYVTAGTMAEKLVSGRSKTVYPSAPSHNVASDVREGGLQWSVKSAFGLAFNATPSMAVYVEPGVGHYIDNGTRVQNFYKSSPTCFNLLVGVRFTPTH